MEKNSKKIIEINDQEVKDHLDKIVRGTVEKPSTRNIIIYFKWPPIRQGINSLPNRI